MAKRKIAIIHMGGTTCMVTSRKTHKIKAARMDESFDSIHRFLPEIQKFTECDFFPFHEQGSSEVMPQHWTELAEFIKSKINDYAGFVVIHGTNTLSYTASALSFALQNLSIPIVFTGGNRPISDLSSDARQNIVFACMVSTMDVAEVCVVYGKRILRANRSRKVSESYASSFASTSGGKIGEVHRTIALYENRIKRRKRRLSFKPEFRGNVPIIQVSPGLNVSMFEDCMDEIDGLIIQGYGPGHVPETYDGWFNLIKKLNKAGKPVVMCSQMNKGEVDLLSYDRGERLLQLGVIPAGEMTIEATYAKLLWCLGQDLSLTRVKKQMQSSLVLEMPIENQTFEVW